MKTNMKASKYFSENNQHIHKLVHNAPVGLSKHQVEAAAVEVYKEIQDGMVISLHDTPRHVWQKAHTINGKEHKRTWGLAINASKKIQKLVEKSRKLEQNLCVLDETRALLLESQKELKRLKAWSFALSAIVFIYAYLKLLGVLI